MGEVGIRRFNCSSRLLPTTPTSRQNIFHFLFTTHSHTDCSRSTPRSKTKSPFFRSQRFIRHDRSTSWSILKSRSYRHVYRSLYTTSLSPSSANDLSRTSREIRSKTLEKEIQPFFLLTSHRSQPCQSNRLLLSPRLSIPLLPSSPSSDKQQSSLLHLSH